MADEVQRLEEENSSLRSKIEEVQQERRAGFAEAEELSRAVSAHEENERLKAVLANQEETLAREREVRNSMLDDEPAKNDLGLPIDMPYTYSPEGPIVSTEADDSDRESVADDSDTDDVSAPTTPSVSRLFQDRSDDTDADDVDKEN